MVSTTTREFMDKLIDINAYKGIFNSDESMPSPRNGTWFKYDWLDISDWTIDDPRVANIGIRADQNKGPDSDEIAYSYERDGWNMTSFPPIVGTDGRPRNGRTRIIAAIKNGQKWIPIAYYIFTGDKDEQALDSISNGIVLNNHPHNKRSTMDDFIMGGVRAVQQTKKLERDEVAIMSWLVHNCAIEDRFSNKAGIWTKITSSIMEQTASEDSLTLVWERERWLEWLSAVPGLPRDSILYKATSGTAASKYWTDHVLPNAGRPQPVVLYTDKYTPEKCSTIVDNFINELDAMYVQTYQLVNNDLVESPLSLSVPKTRPYTILGVTPNLKRGSQSLFWEQHQLVDTDQYIQDGNAVNSLSFVDE